MYSIELKNIQFKSFHGLYPEERILGNLFEINLKVNYEIKDVQSISISETVNYETLFSIIDLRMKQPTELLETILKDISTEILNQIDIVNDLTISITKKNPPINNFNGDVSVTLHTKRF